MIERPRAGCVALLGLLLAACGPPTGPSVTLHPTPLARPQLFWPEAAADHYDQSWVLAEMATWQSFDITVRPLGVDERGIFCERLLSCAEKIPEGEARYEDKRYDGEREAPEISEKYTVGSESEKRSHGEKEPVSCQSNAFECGGKRVIDHEGDTERSG